MLRFPIRVLVLIVPLTFVALAEGQDSNFTPLFNGTDLTGWRYGKEILQRQTETPDGRYSTSGNSIVIARKDKDGKSPTKELFAVRDFTKDFVLKLEFKAAQESIAYVTIRNYPIPVSDFVRRGEQPHLKKSFKSDDWNEFEITVKMAAHADGRKLTDSDNLETTFQNGKASAKINGRTIDPNRVLVQIEGYPRINGQAMTSYAHALPSKGQVGIRTGSGKIEFRNLRFRELP
jgi:hypothetical protein